MSYLGVIEIKPLQKSSKLMQSAKRKIKRYFDCKFRPSGKIMAIEAKLMTIAKNPTTVL
jgi:hypothetical protein